MESGRRKVGGRLEGGRRMVEGRWEGAKRGNGRWWEDGGSWVVACWKGGWRVLGGCLGLRVVGLERVAASFVVVHD